MRQTAFLIAASFALASCVHDGDEKLSSPDDAAGVAINGEAAYVEHCASCHETGILGAPREGQPEEWAGRSNLWQAVLMEHAKTGYFEMPARGGRSDLSDEIINAASEYMIELTFPDRQKD